MAVLVGQADDGVSKGAEAGDLDDEQPFVAVADEERFALAACAAQEHGGGAGHARPRCRSGGRGLGRAHGASGRASSGTLSAADLQPHEIEEFAGRLYPPAGFKPAGGYRKRADPLEEVGRDLLPARLGPGEDEPRGEDRQRRISGSLRIWAASLASQTPVPDALRPLAAARAAVRSNLPAGQ